MEHEIDKIITCKYNNKTITLKVTPIRDSTCSGCFFYKDSKTYCFSVKNVIGSCAKLNRKDKTSIIFKQIIDKTMKEPFDLTKILKNCPEGTKLYSPVLGDVTFVRIDYDKIYPIIVNKNGFNKYFTYNGKMIVEYDGECILFPSKEQRDWNKFTAPWYKKDKFDPNTLKPFDKVLVRDTLYSNWVCNLFSHIIEIKNYSYKCVVNSYRYCIPYNDDTKHLAGKADNTPDYYRYWEE